jgi:hypothetical protein
MVLDTARLWSSESPLSAWSSDAHFDDPASEESLPAWLPANITR